jgi:phosphoribosylamine--glycine ligase
LQKENIRYQGFIFFGLMNVDGDPYVIEYNCRMGDPESEAVMPRIKSDFLELLMAVKDQQLDQQTIEFDNRYAASVFMVSGGYPDAYEKGKKITGIENVENSIVFHAGTNMVDDHTVTTGGRVLAVTSLADKLEDALELSYQNIRKVNFDQKYFRRDLGQDLLNYKS